MNPTLHPTHISMAHSINTSASLILKFLNFNILLTRRGEKDRNKEYIRYYIKLCRIQELPYTTKENIIPHKALTSITKRGLFGAASTFYLKVTFLKLLYFFFLIVSINHFLFAHWTSGGLAI
jgi:hypothetical protein